MLEVADVILTLPSAVKTNSTQINVTHLSNEIVDTINGNVFCNLVKLRNQYITITYLKVFIYKFCITKIDKN